MSTETTQTEVEVEEVNQADLIEAALDADMIKEARRSSAAWTLTESVETPVEDITLNRIKDKLLAQGNVITDLAAAVDQIKDILIDNDFNFCDITGHLFHDDNLIMANNNYDGYRRCDTISVNEEFHTFDCDDCSDTFLANDSFNRRHGVDESQRTSRTDGLCQSCYDENHTSCQECGDSMSNDDAHYTENGDGPYCSSCLPSETVLKEVCFNLRLPRAAQSSADPLAVAWEVEFYPDSGACDASSHDCNRVYHDSSLGDGGQELTTQPVLIDNARARLESLSDTLRGTIDDKCGGHLHVDARYLCKLVFGGIGGDSCDYYKQKIAAVLPIFQNFLLPLVEPQRAKCQIKNHGFACNVQENTEITGDKYRTIQMGSLAYGSDSHRQTVEFRLWHGSLNQETLYRRAEVCEAMIRYLSKMLENVQSVRQDVKDHTNAVIHTFFEDLDRNFNDVYELINRAEGGREHRVRLLDRCRTMLGLTEEWYAWAVTESAKLFYQG